MKVNPVSCLIFIPTYNERENVEPLTNAILEQGLDCDLLFLDDDSPDGTGSVLDKLAERHPRIMVLHRKGKAGIGSAHQAGIAWAYERGYEWLITMDADFAHPPEYLSKLLEVTCEDATVVVGSRYLKRGSLPGWSAGRKMLTHLGHAVTVALLGMPYDATTAFRFYRLGDIPRETFALVRSQGYSFFFESLFVLHVNRFPIRQIPIHLPGRTFGASKMDSREVATSVRFLFFLLGRKMLTPGRLRIRR
ncbi:glycosyltransferase [Nonomuraea sp. H19]|uniref:glycosyltransferase n=1 Tax=Nonomuraea sp. H19 TaxID=3452206 RepID=UPI003F8B02C5